MLDLNFIRYNILYQNYSISKHIVDFFDFEARKIKKEYLKNICPIDSIEDFNRFREGIHTLKKKYKRYNKINHLGNEENWYGHVSAFMDYAGMEGVSHDPFSSTQHGVFLEDDYTDIMNRVKKSPALISYNNFHRNQAHLTNNTIPFFAIGPYIHYAKPYYDKETFIKMKNKYGKIALIVPSHNYTNVTSIDDKEFVDRFLNVIGDSFNSIFVCVFWEDMDYSYVNEFEKRGCKIVSCGFAGDSMFLRRQRTLIEMSDYVFGNNFGTHIGYVQHLKKKFVFVNTNEPNIRVDISFFKNNPSDDDVQRQEFFFNHFYGGENAILCKEQMHLMLSFVGEIYKSSLGFRFLFKYNTKRLLKKYNNHFLYKSIS